jgi:hypothetical protein
MQLQDALYNWLTIKRVVEARPDDAAALDTYEFFNEILEEDHGIEKTEIKQDDMMYYIHYWIDGEEEKKRFPIELIDALLHSIETEPKYNNQ